MASSTTTEESFSSAERMLTYRPPPRPAKEAREEELGWRERDKEETTPLRPRLTLFDPTSVPKGRAYFDHDNRDSFVPKDQRSQSFRGSSSYPQRHPHPQARGGRPPFRTQRGHYHQNQQREHQRRDPYQDSSERGGNYPIRRGRTDSAWNHDGFAQLENSEV